MAEVEVPPLGYDPRPPWHRRRNWRRFKLWGRLTVVALLVGLYVWERGPVLYWHYRGARYEAPPDQLIYDDDPPEAASLRARGRHWWQCIYVAPCPRAVDKATGSGLPTLLLHHRHSPSGPTVLASVSVLRYLSQPNGGYSLVLLHATAPPPTWVPRSRIKEWLPGETEVFVPAGSRLRLFAGGPDPHDESHFTIGYELGGIRGTIDGWLRDDGYIELKTRDGPAVVRTAHH